ncbi:hypothetical protein CHISP_2739 [Chitinispirillum alkaliphilum]|nr:hypothetical protein CHISP_2739 [Chitinispirillum alkaliphilum]
MATESENFVDYNIDCFGTGPWWRLKIVEDKVFFDNYHEDVYVSQISKIKKAEGYRTIWTIHAENDDDDDKITMFISREDCCDSMKHDDHTYLLLFYHQQSGLAYKGCCNEMRDEK